MKGQLPLEGRIHFLYGQEIDDEFTDIKMEVFSAWIMEALFQAGEPDKPETHRGVFYNITNFFLNRLGFNVMKSSATSDILKKSLDECIAGGWVRKESGRQDSEIWYSLQEKGLERLKKLEKQRVELHKACYDEFLHMLLSRLSAAKIEITTTDELKALVGSQDLRAGFDRLLGLMSDEAAHTSIGKEYDGDVLGKDYAADALFPLASVADAAIRKALRKAIRGAAFSLMVQGGSDKAPGIQHWFWLKAYELLFERFWPDEDIQELLGRNLSCIYVYLDTNVLIAALSKADGYHFQAKRIIDFLLANKVTAFWLSDTEAELDQTLAVSKQIVALLQQRPRKEIYEILEQTRPSSFVESYFVGGWRSWRQFETNIRGQLEKLKQSWQPRNQEVVSWIENKIVSTQEAREFETIALRILGNPDFQHDAKILSTVSVLRKQMPPSLVSEDCKQAFENQRFVLGDVFWIVSFDNKLNMVQFDRPSEGDRVRLTLLYGTILLFLDPYVVSKALKAKDGRLDIAAQLPLRGEKDIQRAIDRAKDDWNIIKTIDQILGRIEQQETKKLSPNNN